MSSVNQNEVKSGEYILELDYPVNAGYCYVQEFLNEDRVRVIQSDVTGTVKHLYRDLKTTPDECVFRSCNMGERDMF